MQSTQPINPRLLHALLALTAAVLFLFLHPYRGIMHDARLYTIQALSHLRPELYANDVFLRFGSQDNFTLFSPLYAWLISGLGLEPAAAALTLCSSLLFFIASFLLTRQIASTRQAWAALLLLLLIPSFYGSHHIFYFIEEFVTPRQLAEALTIFSVLAWLKDRRVLGAVVAAGAMAIHPVMGLPGAVFLVTFEWVMPRWQKLWPMGVVAALVAMIAAGGWLPLHRWQFDNEWYALVASRLYLNLHDWTGDAWERVVVVFATLAIASIVLEQRLRRIALAAILACGSLLLLAFVGGDLLRIVIIVQAQPWRAMWLATTLALVLFPGICVRGWQDGGIKLCAPLLLAASWAALSETLGAGLAVLALAFAAFGPRVPKSFERLLLGGAWSALTITLLFTLADAQLSLQDGLAAMGNYPRYLDRIFIYCSSGVPPALILAAGGYCALKFRSDAMVIGLSIITAIVLLAIAKPTIQTWTDVHKFDSPIRSFAAWRAKIPEGSDVLWTGGSSEEEAGTLNTWLLLERPSFISRIQASNALFSRGAAIEMRDRAQSLRGLVLFLDPYNSKSPAPRTFSPLLQPICTKTKVRYIVSKIALPDAVGTPAPASAGPIFHNYKLYSCL
jgi:hypothetical protein